MEWRKKYKKYKIKYMKINWKTGKDYKKIENCGLEITHTTKP